MTRRPAVDVARVLALLIVVMGHLSLAVVDRGPSGGLRGANLLALRPHWAWIAAAAPMPVFFAAAGWAGATTGGRDAVLRLRRLIGLGAVVVAAWSIAVILANAATGHSGIIGDGARIATQPLWFLAVYVPCAAAGRWLAARAAAHPIRSVGLCVLAVAGLDAVRFLLDGPAWLGWLGFFPAWTVPWLVGGWWRDRWEAGRLHERPAGLALFASAGLAAVALVRFGGYQASLIDAVAGARSNTTPPTLYTALAAAAQVGALLVVARPLDRLGRRFRRFWSRAGEAAVGIYLWHLTALALCIGAVALGAPMPRRLSAAWWAIRPLWWGVVLAVTAALIAATAAVRARLPARDREAPEVPAARWVAGVVVGTAAAAAVGLDGPTGIPGALAYPLLFATAWYLLASPVHRRVPALVAGAGRSLRQPVGEAEPRASSS